jgi:hypothetical protein
VEVAWSMGTHVSRDERDEGIGYITPSKVEERCVVVKSRREVGDVIGK